MNPSRACLSLVVLCGVLSVGSLIAGLIWIREGRLEIARGEVLLRRHLESNPPQQGGCPKEADIAGLILAASNVEPGVRRSEGEAAVLAGFAGLGVSLLLLAGARWTLWLGLVHATVTGLLAPLLFFFAWHGDAKAVFLLWFAYGAGALGSLHHLRRLYRIPGSVGSVANAP